MYKIRVFKFTQKYSEEISNGLKWWWVICIMLVLLLIFTILRIVYYCQN